MPCSFTFKPIPTHLSEEGLTRSLNKAEPAQHKGGERRPLVVREALEGSWVQSSWIRSTLA